MIAGVRHCAAIPGIVALDKSQGWLLGAEERPAGCRDIGVANAASRQHSDHEKDSGEGSASGFLGKLAAEAFWREWALRAAQRRPTARTNGGRNRLLDNHYFLPDRSVVRARCRRRTHL